MCKGCVLTKWAILLATVFMAFQVFGQDKIETVVQQGHLSQVLCADVSPNSKFIVTGSVDNSIKLWNAENGKEIRSFKQHSEKVLSVQFSPDGKQILSAGADEKAIVYDLLTGKVLNVFIHEKVELNKAVFSKNGKYVLSMSNRNDLYLWDLSSGKLVKRYDKSYSSDITPLTLSPSGHLILNSGNYKQCYATSVNSNDSLVFEFDKPYEMAFSPNGEYVVISSAKLFAGVFDSKSGKELSRLEGTDGRPCDGCNTSITISNDSKLIATAGKNADFIIWSSSGKKVKTLETELKERVNYIRFSHSGTFVVIADDKSFRTYNAKSGKLVFQWTDPLLSYYEPVFSTDESFMVTPGENNTAYLWDIQSGVKKQILSGYLNLRSDEGLGLEYTNWTERYILKYVTKKAGMTVTPDGKYILKGRIDSSVVMLDINTGRTVKTFTGHRKSVLALDVSSDGKLLATGGGDGMVCLWDLQSGKKIKELRHHSAMIFDVRFSNNGEMLASSSWDATTRIWNVLSGESLGYVKTGEVSQFINAFVPGDLYLATGNLDKTLLLWEVDAKEQFRSYTGHTNIITGIDFIGDQMVSSSWDGTLKVWDIGNGMLKSKFKHDGTGLFAVVCDQSSGLVFSGGSDGKIKVWDLESRSLKKELSGHTGAVVSLKVTSDNKLVSCSEQGVIKVWDLKTWTELYTYMIFDRDNWLVKHKSGRFDGSAKAMQMVNYVSGVDVVPVGSLFKKYYAPGLLKRIMNGEQFKDIGQNIDTEIKSAPIASVALAGGGKRSISIGQDSVIVWRKDNIPLTVTIDESSEDISDVRIYRNGKLLINEPFVEELVFRGGNEKSRTFDVGLNDGKNEISVVVSNKRSVESDPAVIKVDYDGEAAKTDLYILSIGINGYKNPAYKLNYAVNDADAFAKSVTDGSSELFNKIHTYSIRNDQADKTTINNTFAEIIKNIGPEDVFVFYYAGHGVMSIEETTSEFYIVTYDVTNFYGSVEMLKEKAVSAEELMDFSRRINAEKQLFVMDACQSGGALQAFAQRGAVREKALAQLARSTGTFFLTASEDAQYANEVGGLEHGMFTYAILEALGGTGESDHGDQKITVNELRTYVEDRVPELSEQYQGSPQYPTSYSFGQDFPVTIVKKAN